MTAIAESADHKPASAVRGMPLVSVIMPCYNTARYIADAIESVLDQDYPNLELIVVDDGSTDSTRDVIAGYGSRLRLLEQQNQGAAVARNRGLSEARGDVIAFLDSDDLWLPGKLSAQVDYLEAHPDIGAVFSRWAEWTPEASGSFPSPERVLSAHSPPAAPGAIVPERSGWLYNRLLFSSLMHTITVVIRRETVQAVGLFDTELKRGQDYDYWLRLSRETEIHQLDVVHALYRLHGDGCITKWPDVNYEYLVVRKALQTWGPCGPRGELTPERAVERRLCDICSSFGYYHYHEGDPELALKAYPPCSEALLE